MFLIDGYPRSGNTFAQMLVKNVFSGVETVHHFHSLGAVKISLSKSIPSFIIYRDPVNSIASNYLWEKAYYDQALRIDAINKDLLNYFLEFYIKFYEFINTKQNDIFLISFDKLIKDPEKIMIAINERIPTGSKKDVNDIISIVSSVKETQFGAKGMLSTRPNQTKDELKKELFPHIEEFEIFKTANHLYEKLKKSNSNI
ncbi:MAG: hypothetical protein ACJAX3_001156 [Patiriisocius sp.]